MADASAINSFPSDVAFDRLARRDVRYVLVHFDRRSAPDPSDWRRRLEPYRQRVAAVYESEEAALYELVPGD